LLVPQLWEWTDGVQAAAQVCKAEMSSSEQEEYLGRFAAGPWRAVYTAAKKKLDDPKFAGVMGRRERIEAQWVCSRIPVDDGDGVLTYGVTRRRGTAAERRT